METAVSCNPTSEYMTAASDCPTTSANTTQSVSPMAYAVLPNKFADIGERYHYDEREQRHETYSLDFLFTFLGKRLL